MSNPERFKDYLENALSEHQRKQKRQKKRAKDQQKKAKRREKEIIKQQNQAANQAVAELDSQFPIRGFIEGLQAAVVPLGSVRKYGPKDGKISYCFPYRIGFGKKEVGRRSLPGPPPRAGPSSVPIYCPIVWRKALGVTLNDEGNVSVKLADRYFLKSLNPTTWPDRGLERVKKIGEVSIISEEGIDEFKGILTRFYLGVKGPRG